MSSPTPNYEIAEKYLASANSSVVTLRLLYYTFVLLGIYLTGVFIGVQHEQLLTQEPLRLPIVYLYPKLEFAFIFIPILYILFHFVLLLQFYLLAYKLLKLSSLSRNLNSDEREHIKTRISDFMLSHLWIVDSHGYLIKFFLKFIMWLSLIPIPLAILCFIQSTFLPYHHSSITWAHRCLIASDIAIIACLWWRLFDKSILSDSAPDGWVRFWNGVNKYHVFSTVTAIFFLINAFLVLVYPNEFLYNKDLLQSLGPVLNIVRGEPKPNNRLILRDAILVGNGLNPELEEKIRSNNASEKYDALFKIQPLRLENRDFTEADFSGSYLPHTRLRNVIFKDAVLVETEFLCAEFINVSFDGASLKKARFNVNPQQGTKSKTNGDRICNSSFKNENDGKGSLANTEISGTDFSFIEFPDANFRGAKGEAPIFFGAQLKNADFVGTNIPKSDFRTANLEGAVLNNSILDDSRLINATLVKASMTLANLVNTNLNGADLTDANMLMAHLNGTKLVGVQMKKTVLWKANIDGKDADFTAAVLDSADVRNTEFSGSEFVGATVNNIILRGSGIKLAKRAGASFMGSYTGMGAILTFEDVQQLPQGTNILYGLTESDKTMIRQQLSDSKNKGDRPFGDQENCVSDKQEYKRLITEVNKRELCNQRHNLVGNPNYENWLYTRSVAFSKIFCDTEFADIDAIVGKPSNKNAPESISG